MNKNSLLILVFVFICVYSYSNSIELGLLEDFKDLNNDGILSLDEISLQSYYNEEIDKNENIPDKTINPLYWSQITLGGPISSENGAMAFDSERNVTVLFGGHTYNESDGHTYLDDTYELNYSGWVYRILADGPIGREGHSMAYYPDKGYIVLFGGRAGQTYFNDTWVYNGVEWKTVITSASPSPRMNFMMAYSPLLKKIILFGGRKITTGLFGECYSDTWAFDGDNWERLNPTATPPARAYAMGDTDTYFDNIMMFGGLYEWNGTVQFLQDTWIFDGTTWNLKNTGNILPLNQFDDLKYDPNRKVFVGFGCSSSQLGNNQTWEYKSGTWYRRYPSGDPPKRLNSRLGYNQPNGGIALFGGYKIDNLMNVYMGDTYILNGPTYTEQDQWTFELSDENWRYYNPTSQLQCGWETGRLYFNIKGNSNAFAFWCSPVTTLYDSRLYRARYIISTDIQDKSKFPVLRFRCNSADGSFSSFNSITSVGSGELSPNQNIMTNFDQYFVPGKTTSVYGAVFCVDLLNIDVNDSASGRINIEEVQLESAEIPSFSK